MIANIYYICALDNKAIKSMNRITNEYDLGMVWGLCLSAIVIIAIICYTIIRTHRYKEEKTIKAILINMLENDNTIIELIKKKISKSDTNG